MRSLVLVVASTIVLSPQALASGRCEDSLVINTSYISQDIATQYSVLQLINETNYESYKSQLKAGYADLFGGDWNSFREKRSNFLRIFAESGYASSVGKYYMRALSADSAANYAKCLAYESAAPLMAWVEAADEAHKKIHVKVRSGSIGSTVIKYTSSVESLSPPSELTSGSDETLIFPYEPKDGITISFNGKINNVVGSYSTSVNYPSNVRYVVDYEEKQLGPMTIKIRGGGSGSVTNYQSSTTATFVAPDNYVLLPETFAIGVQKITLSTGISSYKLVEKYLYDGERRPRTLTVFANNIVGLDKDGTGEIELPLSIRSRRAFIRPFAAALDTPVQRP